MLVASIFHDFIVQPIFNVLVFIYALLPGHNFGLAIIIFTIFVRLAMWPLVKKQLHQTKVMRRVQPQLKRIKAETKGDKQKESRMVMELYKEQGISPFGSIGTIIVQFVILIGLYIGLKGLVDNPKVIVDNAYGWIQNLSWMQTLAKDISQFDETLLGLVDLTRPAIAPTGGGVYWPAMLLVLGSAIGQYFQSVQLMPKAKDGLTLRKILRDAKNGEQADQSDVTAAMSRSLRFVIPVMIFFFTVNLASALSLYWFVGAIVAYIQQGRVLGKDEEELEAIADEPTKKSTKKAVAARDIIEGEVVATATPKAKKAKKSKGSTKKRRK